MYFWTANGDTTRMPFARMSSYAKTNSSVEPIPVPMDTINRRVSTSGVPAFSHTRRPGWSTSSAGTTAGAVPLV